MALYTAPRKLVLVVSAVALGVVLGTRSLVWGQEQPPGAASVLAQRVSSDAQAQPIDVVVTGARSEERADRASVATEVIRRAEVEASGARDVAQVLEERGGLQIVRSYRGAELQLRGLDSEYTLVLVDSERVPGQFDGAIDLSRYGVENIERVEIVRGPSSALYGADAIAGVVNIITREPKRAFEADALGSYGQRNTLDLTGTLAGRPTDKLRLLINAGLHRSDAYARPGEVQTAISARDQWYTGLRVSFEPNSRHRLLLRAAYLRAGLDGVDAGAGGATYDRRQVQEQPQLSVEHRVHLDARVTLTSRVSYGQFRSQYLQDQRGADTLDSYEDNREHLAQASSVARLAWSDAHRTTLGVEGLLQHLDSARLERAAQRERGAVFAQHAWLLTSGSTEFEIVPGVRLDADSQFGTRASPKLALRFRPIDKIELRASYGRAFRAPTFQELLLRFENTGVGYVVHGNPDLDAETSTGIDAGVRFRDEHFELSLTLFRNELDNMIAYATLPANAGTAAGLTQYTYENLTHAWTRGLESSASVRLRDELALAFGYTLLDGWDGEHARKLQGRAVHRVTASARLWHPGTGVELVGRAALSVGRTFYVAQADGSERAATPAPLGQLDLRLAKHIERAFEVFVGIDNLLSAGDAYTALMPFTAYGGVRARH